MADPIDRDQERRRGQRVRRGQKLEGDQAAAAAMPAKEPYGVTPRSGMEGPKVGADRSATSRKLRNPAPKGLAGPAPKGPAGKEGRP